MTKLDSMKKAAIAFSCYGVVVLVGGLLYAIPNEDFSQFPRALIRVVGVLAISQALWQHKKWAWWLGTIMSGFFLAIGIVLVIILGYAAQSNDPMFAVFKTHSAARPDLIFATFFTLSATLRYLLMKSSRDLLG